MDAGNNGTVQDEGNVDPGRNQYHSSGAEDFEGRHRHSNVYSGLSIPIHRRRSKHHKHRHHHRHATSKEADIAEERPDGSHHHHHHHRHKHHQGDLESFDEQSTDGFYLTPPSQRVQFILGFYDDDDMHNDHPLFCEMETLCLDRNGDYEWKETARWVKFEEDVEEGGERWSKPHVATLSLHSLFELRSQLLSGCVIFDLDAFNLVQIVDIIADNLVNKNHLSFENKEKYTYALLQKHKHLYEKKKGTENGNMSRLPLIRSLAEIGRNHSSAKSGGATLLGRAFSFAGQGAPTSQMEASFDKSPSQGSITQVHSSNCLESDTKKGNIHFMRKIPIGSEAANILVGEVDFLDKPVSAFVRLSQAVSLGNITEVPVPTRFIYVLLGPMGALPRYHEIGRAIATLLSDEVFHVVAYKAKNADNLLSGIDEFLDAVTVLPPGEWDPAIRIEPPSEIPSQDSRKMLVKSLVDEEEEEMRQRKAAGLTRTGRLFGGLIDDVKRKAPHYLSDIKDGLSIQSLAAFFFLYFACLTPLITFGGLLGDATGNNIAAMESLVAGLICGVIYGLFSGQPLTILGSTGPVLVFETIVYNFCIGMEWNYLSFRLWIGLWAALILLILVAIDASALVCYITRFTEENFATLIAFIFIYKACEKVLNINNKYPVEKDVDKPKFCDCIPPGNRSEFPTVDWGNITNDECLSYNATLFGEGCVHYYPDVFLMSLILFFGTFLISIYLKNFKTALFFPNKVRCFISDFAVIISILVMILFDWSMGIATPKLDVPPEFKPTNEGRGWLIHPFNGNPWWTCLIAILPALLACILLFMDQQITSVIVNRKEHLLKKGGGFHLDLFILSILIAINSIMGLPWFVAATVLSINHVNALKKESESSAPGEKPQFLGVRENRVTHICIFIMIGMSVLVTKVLKVIPMPILYGVFLYMGIAALKGIQFFDRILLLFMPLKYQPDYAFLRQVPLQKVHIFTFIQLFFLVFLWIIKSFKQTSILFPLMLVVMVGARKCLDWVFTQRELKSLDDTLPEISRKEKLIIQEEEDPENHDEPGADTEGMVSIPLANGNVMKVPATPINISEEMNKSGIWKDINNESKPSDCEKKGDQHCKRCRRRSRKNSKHSGQSNGQVSPVNEEEDLDANEINFTVKKNKPNDVTLSLDSGVHFTKKRGSKHDAINDEEKRRLSLMIEEDEEDCAISIKVTKA